jgi:hypothetical protein
MEVNVPTLSRTWKDQINQFIHRPIATTHVLTQMGPILISGIVFLGVSKDRANVGRARLLPISYFPVRRAEHFYDFIRYSVTCVENTVLLNNLLTRQLQAVCLSDTSLV